MNGMETLVKLLKEEGYTGSLGSHKGKQYKILWDLEQRSELWRKLRDGSCGGTGAYNLLKNGYKVSSKKERAFKPTSAMKWGIDHEEPAREAFLLVPQVQNFMFKENLEGVEAGMILRPDIEKKVHYSPDWLLVDKNDHNLIKGICEIKCFGEEHHMELVRKREADKEIQCQMQFGMFLCQVDYCYFIAYNPRLKENCLFVKKYYKNKNYQEAFRKALS